MTATINKNSVADCFDAKYKSSDSCFAVIDSEGRILEANPGLEKLLGHTADELMGKQFTDLLAPPAAKISHFVEVTLKYFFKHSALVYSAMLACRDGARVGVRLMSRHVDAAGHVLIELIRDNSISSVDDLTAKSDDSFLENVFATIGDGLYVTDALGQVVKTNPALAEMLGYTQQELIGKHSAQFSAATDASCFSEIPEFLKQLLSCGFVENHESVWRKKDGSTVQVELKVRLLKNSAGAMIGAVSAVRDISQRNPSEAALRESELRFRVMANTASDGIIFLDNQGRIFFWNLGAQNIYGYAYREMLGKTPEIIMPAEIFKNHIKLFRQPEKLASFPPMTFESTGVHKNGHRFSAEISLSSGKADQSLFFCAIVRDITERKKAEQALRDSEERFRELAQSLPEGIIAVDTNGTIVFWNQGAQNLFGFTKEEALGKPSTIMLPERYYQTEKEALNLLRQGGFSSFLGRTVQGCARRKDGTEFADEISAGPWQTRQGLYYVAIIRDITERMKAEQALKDSEQRFKELADSLPETVFELNRAGIITFVNRTALDAFGYTQSDIDKGLHALHIIVPEQRLMVRENTEKIYAGERLGGQEYLALRKDGTTFPCIIHASTILVDGKPQGIRGLLIDITMRKELEEEMNKSKRLASISTLAGGVAQDFNTTLSIILGNINLAQHLVASEDRASEHLSAAEHATLRAKDLTAQLIAFAKGGTALKTIVSVEKLLRDAADSAIKGSNVTCSFSFPQDLLPARLDETQMRQVFMNLLINADHAMPEGGSIEVKAANVTIGPADNLPLPNGAYVKITISDQSIGILNEHLQQLFDPYFTSRQRGSGIGLATTYTIIKNHGGLITVESEFGRGTTFHIFLPAKKT